LEEYLRPGEFHPEKAVELGVPRGPLWSKLQNGETVKSAAGLDVRPQDVLGQPRLGRKVSFVTDSLAFPEISPEVAGSDLFVCEGMFEQELAEDAHNKKHMTAVEAARIAARSTGVKKLALIHFSPRYTEFNLKLLLNEAREVFSDTVLARDKAVFPVEYMD
jgi:ribonuclease Z